MCFYPYIFHKIYKKKIVPISSLEKIINIDTVNSIHENNNKINVDYSIFNNKYVLVVDDSIVYKKILYKYLNGKGCYIFYFNNGKEALDSVTLISVDLIISDINMPEMNGIEFTKCVRENLHIKTPIILYSTDKHLSEEAYKAGANLFLPKPFKIKELEEAIFKFI